MEIDEIDSATKPTAAASNETNEKSTSAAAAAPPKEDPKPTIQVKGQTLPASGQWKGSFDTLTGRKGQQKTTLVHETFTMRWDLTPSDTASILLEKQRPLPEHHVYVTGQGENQYGPFEFVGALDLATLELQCQKRYIVVPEQPPPPEPPRVVATRKRQMSWKRRAFFDDSDDDHEPQHQAAAKAASAFAKQHPLPPPPPTTTARTAAVPN